ncbi:MAG: hypothetical protein ACTHJ0_01620, partial [Flavipsychrobacter sp.]
MQLPKAKRKAISQLVLLDYVAAAIAWMTFWIYRHQLIDHRSFAQAVSLFRLKDYIAGLIILPGGWLFLYLLSGTYFDLYRKSRLNEINRTLISCIIGSILVALIVFANDENDYSYFIRMTGRYLLIHTAYTLILRLLILNHVKNNLVRGKVGFKTLIIGGNQEA